MKFFVISILFFSFLSEGLQGRLVPAKEDELGNAFYKRDVEKIKKLIKEGIDTDQLDLALTWFYRLRNTTKVEITKFLIEHDTKLPLYWASKDNDNVEIAKLLIKNKTDMNERDKNGKTALHYVNSVEMAKLLIENGADVNTRDEDGKTPLHYVNNVEIAKLLIENGAEVNAMSNKGQTPCDTAFKGPYGWGCEAVKDHFYYKYEYKKVRNFIIKQGGTGGKGCKYDYFSFFKTTMFKLYLKTFCRDKNACGPVGQC